MNEAIDLIMKCELTTLVFVAVGLLMAALMAYELHRTKKFILEELEELRKDIRR